MRGSILGGGQDTRVSWGIYLAPLRGGCKEDRVPGCLERAWQRKQDAWVPRGKHLGSPVVCWDKGAWGSGSLWVEKWGSGCQCPPWEVGDL